MPRCSDHPLLAVIAGLHNRWLAIWGGAARPSMRILASYDQTLADAFKAAVITFPTAWLIAGKRACKDGKSKANRYGHKQARRSPVGRSSLDLIGNRECLVERADSRCQFLGATGFKPQGKAVMVQLL